MYKRQTINTPKGPTYLRPADHQGLAEMYIAKAVNDTRSGSETENLIIAELVDTLNYSSVAPPVESVWNDVAYVPGGFAPSVTTTTTSGTTTPTGTTTEPPPIDFLTIGLIGGMGALILVLVVLLVRKK